MNKAQYALFLMFCISSSLSFAATKQERYTPSENKSLNMPFSEGVRVGKTIYLSGQIGALPGKDAVVPGGIIPETEQALKKWF